MGIIHGCYTQTRAKDENASWAPTTNRLPLPQVSASSSLPSFLLPLLPAPAVTAGGSMLPGLLVQWEHFARLSSALSCLMTVFLGGLNVGAWWRASIVRGCYQSLSCESMFARLLANVGVCWQDCECGSILCLVGAYSTAGQHLVDNKL